MRCGGQQTYFELGVIIHENGHDSNVWHKPGDDINAYGQEISLMHNLCQFVTDDTSNSTSFSH